MSPTAPSLCGGIRWEPVEADGLLMGRSSLLVVVLFRGGALAHPRV
jgi:hypothetical protein